MRPTSWLVPTAALFALATTACEQEHPPEYSVASQTLMIDAVQGTWSNVDGSIELRVCEQPTRRLENHCTYSYQAQSLGAGRRWADPNNEEGCGGCPYQVGTAITAHLDVDGSAPVSHDAVINYGPDVGEETLRFDGDALLVGGDRLAPPSTIDGRFIGPGVLFLSQSTGLPWIGETEVGASARTLQRRSAEGCD